MKIILTILSSLFWVCSMAQFPNTHSQSNGHTKEVFGGAINPQKGLINGRYADTAAANLDYVKDEPGVQIVVGDDIWLRNSTATKWILIATNIISIQNGLISGGVVTWSGTGLIFDVTAATYIKNGSVYVIPSGRVTLLPSDPDNPRIDLIVADTTTNTFSVVTGVASAVPITPQADLFSQIALTTGILLNAGDTIPSDLSSLIIYDENNAPPEWTVSNQLNVVYNKDDGTMPYTGVRDIAVSSYTGGISGLVFQGNAQTVEASKILKFRVKLTDTIPSSNSMVVILYDTSTSKVVSSTGTFKNGFGFRQDDVVDYQNVSIPFTSLGSFADTSFNRILFYFYGTNIAPFYIDRVELQDGIVNIPPQIDYSNKVDSMSKLGDSIYYWIKGVPVLVGSVGSGTGIDSTAYHSLIQAPDSSYYGIKDLQNRVDTIVVVAGDGSGTGGGGSAGVQSIVAGDNITVDNTDPSNPIVSATGGGGGSDSTTASNGLTLVGKDVQLGGTLTKSDTLNAGTNVLNINYSGGNSGVVISSPNGNGVNSVGGGIWWSIYWWCSGN